MSFVGWYNLLDYSKLLDILIYIHIYQISSSSIIFLSICLLIDKTSATQLGEKRSAHIIILWSDRKHFLRTLQSLLWHKYPSVNTAMFYCLEICIVTNQEVVFQRDNWQKEFKVIHVTNYSWLDSLDLCQQIFLRILLNPVTMRSAPMELSSRTH